MVRAKSGLLNNNQYPAYNYNQTPSGTKPAVSNYPTVTNSCVTTGTPIGTLSPYATVAEPTGTPACTPIGTNIPISTDAVPTGTPIITAAVSPAATSSGALTPEYTLAELQKYHFTQEMIEKYFDEVKDSNGKVRGYKLKPGYNFQKLSLEANSESINLADFKKDSLNKYVEKNLIEAKKQDILNDALSLKKVDNPRDPNLYNNLYNFNQNMGGYLNQFTYSLKTLQSLHFTPDMIKENFDEVKNNKGESIGYVIKSDCDLDELIENAREEYNNSKSYDNVNKYQDTEISIYGDEIIENYFNRIYDYSSEQYVYVFKNNNMKFDDFKAEISNKYVMEPFFKSETWDVLNDFLNTKSRNYKNNNIAANLVQEISSLLKDNEHLLTEKDKKILTFYANQGANVLLDSFSNLNDVTYFNKNSRTQTEAQDAICESLYNGFAKNTLTKQNIQDMLALKDFYNLPQRLVNILEEMNETSNLKSYISKNLNENSSVFVEIYNYSNNGENLLYQNINDWFGIDNNPQNYYFMSDYLESNYSDITDKLKDRLSTDEYQQLIHTFVDYVNRSVLAKGAKGIYAVEQAYIALDRIARNAEVAMILDVDVESYVAETLFSTPDKSGVRKGVAIATKSEYNSDNLDATNYYNHLKSLYPESEGYVIDAKNKGDTSYFRVYKDQNLISSAEFYANGDYNSINYTSPYKYDEVVYNCASGILTKNEGVISSTLLNSYLDEVLNTNDTSSTTWSSIIRDLNGNMGSINKDNIYNLLKNSPSDYISSLNSMWTDYLDNNGIPYADLHLTAEYVETEHKQIWMDTLDLYNSRLRASISSSIYTISENSYVALLNNIYFNNNPGVFDTNFAQNLNGTCWALAGYMATILTEDTELINLLFNYDSSTNIATYNFANASISCNIGDLAQLDDKCTGNLLVRGFELALYQYLTSINGELGEVSTYHYITTNSGAGLESYYDLFIDNTSNLIGECSASKFLTLCDDNQQKLYMELNHNDLLVTCTFNISSYVFNHLNEFVIPMEDDIPTNDTPYVIRLYDAKTGEELIYDEQNTPYQLVTNHAYTIYKIDSEYVYIKNPWGGNNDFKISKKDFEQFGEIVRYVNKDDFKKAIKETLIKRGVLDENGKPINPNKQVNVTSVTTEEYVTNTQIADYTQSSNPNNHTDENSAENNDIPSGYPSDYGRYVWASGDAKVTREETQEDWYNELAQDIFHKDYDKLTDDEKKRIGKIMDTAVVVPEVKLEDLCVRVFGTTINHLDSAQLAQLENIKSVPEFCGHTAGEWIGRFQKQYGLSREEAAEKYNNLINLGINIGKLSQVEQQAILDAVAIDALSYNSYTGMLEFDFSACASDFFDKNYASFFSNINDPDADMAAWDAFKMAEADAVMDMYSRILGWDTSTQSGYDDIIRIQQRDRAIMDEMREEAEAQSAQQSQQYAQQEAASAAKSYIVFTDEDGNPYIYENPYV